MTISNPVPPAGRQEGSTSTGTAQTPNRTGSLTRSNNNSSSSSDSIVLQAHRQSHNSSKLPAYRFADLKSSAISLPSLPRHTSAASEDKTKPRPPTSYKPPNTAHTSGSRATIPPIRSFRSSGSRKSLALDMHGRRVSGDSLSEGPTDPDPRDRALRALEGRRDDDFSHLAPPDSGDMTTTTDNDNTADLFMRIAGEDKSRLALEEQGPTAEPSTISRVIRTTHRRPLSAAIPASDIPSPPQVSRRHSDQRDNARARQVADARPAQQTTKELASRTTARENLPSIATAAEGLSRAHQPRTPLRPSPITPRQLSFNDSFSETGSAYQFRRRSITENNNGSSTRTTPYRAANLTTNRIYHSSPLVPKSPNVQKDDPQHASDPNHGVEGTESSTSTVAPSTVWDELDELKSRIHRLELTGKMMSTSRTSDGRPRTATTATTMSASPKQGSGKSPNQADGNGNKSQPREARPLLQSALGRAKDLVSSDVFNAIELAANEALALSSMMGAPGQPGPISSAASAVGYGSVVGVTDRQLRRKADSICRSLTELCIALAGEASRARNDQPTAAADEKELLLSPTSIVPLATSTQRRPSAPAETMAKSSSSPRSFSALEQKKQVMLAAAPLTPSVLTTAPNRLREPVSAVRSSSLLLNRVRRAGAEEGEEGPVRRSSLLLRARRAGSEEPQENREVRKTSLLLRARRTVDQEEDEYRFRAPSRAVTEVNGPRTAARDLGYAAQPPPSEVSGPTSSAPTRRRFLPSSLTSRLVTTSIPPATPSATPSATPARRYFRVSPQEYGPVDDAAQMAVVEDRAPQKQQQQRQLALSQTTPMLHRSDSLGRRSRENGSIPTSLTPSWQQAQSGGGRYQ